MADDSLGFMAISLSDSESEQENTSTPTEGAGATRADRTALSESAFQELKSTYKAKVENGEIWSTVSLPLGPTVSKPDAQALLHAVEELYFFRRYDEAASFVQAVFSEDKGNGELHLDDETKRLLRHYEAKCVARTQKTVAPSSAPNGIENTP